MVCKNCRMAALIFRNDPETGEAAAREWYDKCKGGTWCDCQRKIPGKGERRGVLCRRRPARAQANLKRVSVAAHN